MRKIQGGAEKNAPLSPEAKQSSRALDKKREAQGMDGVDTTKRPRVAVGDKNKFSPTPVSLEQKQKRSLKKGSVLLDRPIDEQSSATKKALLSASIKPFEKNVPLIVSVEEEGLRIGSEELISKIRKMSNSLTHRHILTAELVKMCYPKPLLLFFYDTLSPPLIVDSYEKLTKKGLDTLGVLETVFYGERLPAEAKVLLSIFAKASVFEQNDASFEEFILSGLASRSLKVAKQKLLYMSFESDSAYLLETLLKDGVDVNQSHPELGVFPVHMARKEGTDRHLQLLLDHGAEPDPRPETPFFS